MTLALYFLVGIIWSSFVAYKEAQIQQIHGNVPPWKMGVSILANAFLWPIAVPLGIYIWNIQNRI